MMLMLIPSIPTIQAARERIAITRAKYIVDQELSPPQASVRVYISAAHSVKELEKAARVIKKAAESV